MKQATASVSLPCTPETFWRVFLDPEYARALYLGELGYRGLEVLEVTETTRKLRVVPKLNLPGPIASLIGDSFAYEDHGVLDRERNVWTWRMVQPAVLAPGAKPKKNVVTTSGTLRIEPISEGSCRRIDTLNIEAHGVRARRRDRVDRGEGSPGRVGQGVRLPEAAPRLAGLITAGAVGAAHRR